MSRTCTVCRHGELTAIDAGLVGGTPRRELARRYGLSATAVRRHAGAHLTERLARAAETEQADSVQLLDQVRGIVADLAGVERECRSAGNGEAYLRTARERLRALELLGKVTGEIQAGTTVN